MRGDLSLNVTPHIILVTYAEGLLFTSTQKKIVESAKKSSHYIYAWNKTALKETFPQHNDIWDSNPDSVYPACIAMKAFLVEFAMKHALQNDWVIYADSSRYYTNGITERFDTFVLRLLQHGLDAYPGTALCGLTNIDNGGLVSRKTFTAFEADRPKYWFAPHFQNNFFAFAKNRRTADFMKRWAEYSLDRNLNCASAVPDQAPFSVLVSKYEFPIVSFCTGINTPHWQELKDVDFIMSRVVLHVLYDYDEFLKSLPIVWDKKCTIIGEMIG